MKFNKGENGYFVVNGMGIQIASNYCKQSVGLVEVYITKLNKNGTCEGFFFQRFDFFSSWERSSIERVLAKRVKLDKLKPDDLVPIKWNGRQSDLLTLNEAKLEMIKFISNDFSDPEEDNEY